MADTRTAKEIESSYPLLGIGETHGSVSQKITSINLTNGFRPGWVLGLLIAFLFVNVLLGAATYLVFRGVGIWGIDIPVAWGFAIINFVWWIGIGHAGTLISAILLLLRQKWRNSINRFAEAMTIFAVMCAGMFPILHLGRPWLFYWLLPYPSTMGVWPQFRSPLIWDVFAVSTYATMSLVFWYVGLIPDFATLRDKSQSKFGRVAYGIVSLGWRNSAVHWERYEMASLLLAGLCTPLVLSVHSVVSFDFAVAQLPGWHTTIFPPYFVAGAIYSGFAMVLTLMIPVRKFYGLENIVTMRHINNMSKVMLATGLMVAYGYLIEGFTGWYGGDKFDHFMAWNRFTGPYAPAYWSLLTCNIIIPQLLWLRKFRLNVGVVWVISIIVNIGMWLERYIIVVTSLHRDFLPSSWGMYYPTIWDWAVFTGTLGFFMFFIHLFIRFLPIIAISEVRSLVTEAKYGAH